MGNKAVTIAALILVLIALTVGVCSCGQRMTSSVISDSRLVVGPQWVQVELPQSFATTWDYQLVELTLVTKFTPSDDPWGIRLDDGSVVLPQVKLITKQGSEEGLGFEGFPGSNRVSFGNDHIARGSYVKKLEIRSPKPLILSRITWISYMPQDTKTGNP